MSLYLLHRMDDELNSMIVLSSDKEYMLYVPIVEATCHEVPDLPDTLSWIHLDNPVLSFKSLSSIISNFSMDNTLNAVIEFYLKRTWGDWRKNQYMVNKYYYHVYMVYIDYLLQLHDFQRIDYDGYVMYDNGVSGVIVADDDYLRRLDDYYYSQNTKISVVRKLDKANGLSLLTGSLPYMKIKRYYQPSENKVLASVMYTKGWNLVISDTTILQSV